MHFYYPPRRHLIIKLLDFKNEDVSGHLQEKSTIFVLYATATFVDGEGGSQF